MAKKAPRAMFALPGGRFPLNTPGRIKAAPGLARYSESKGNITAAQVATVDQKVASLKKGKKKAKKPMQGILSSMNDPYSLG